MSASRPGIDPQADPTGTACRDQRRERAERLGVDEGAGCQRRGKVAIGLSDAVDHDPFGRAAGAQGERQLDRPDDLEPEAVGRQPTQQRRIGVGLDGVGDQRSGERVSPGMSGRRGGVEIGDVERRPPALGRLDQQRVRVHRPIVAA